MYNYLEIIVRGSRPGIFFFKPCLDGVAVQGSGNVLLDDWKALSGVRPTCRSWAWALCKIPYLRCFAFSYAHVDCLLSSVRQS